MQRPVQFTATRFRYVVRFSSSKAAWLQYFREVGGYFRIRSLETQDSFLNWRTSPTARVTKECQSLPPAAIEASDRVIGHKDLNLEVAVGLKDVKNFSS